MIKKAVSANFLSQLIQSSTVLILALVYSPGDIGYYIACFSLGQMFMAVLFFRLDHVMLIGDVSASTDLDSAMSFGLLLGLLTLIMGILVPSESARYILLATSLSASSYLTAGYYNYDIRYRDAAHMMALKVLIPLLILCGQIGISIIDDSGKSLVTMRALSTFIFVFYLVRPKSLSFLILYRMVLRNASIIRNSFFAVLLSRITEHGFTQVVFFGFGEVIAGYYGIATRLISLPSAIFGKGISSVISVRDKSASSENFILLQRLLVVGGLGMFLILYVTAWMLDSAVESFGPLTEWLPAIPILMPLCIVGYSKLIASAYSQEPYLHNRANLVSVIEATKLLFLGFGIAVAMPFQSNFSIYLYVVSVFWAVGYSIQFIIGSNFYKQRVT